MDQVNTAPRTQVGTIGTTRSWLPLAVVCSGFFVVILDTTVVTIALDRIADSLHTTITGLEWVVDGYTVILASLLLLGGTLSDRLGARRAFQAGLLLFGAASLGCALAGTVELLVAVRLLQGLGGALLIPSSLALIRLSYPDEAERAKAIGVWGAVGATAASFGPVIGGLLSQTLGWRAVFAVNVPVCLLALVLVVRLVPSSPGVPRRLNPLAQLAVVAAVGGVSSVTIQAGSEHPDAWILLGSAAVFVTGLLVVIGLQRIGPDPLLPRVVLATRHFRVGNYVGFLLNFGFYGQLFVISLFLQRHLGYSPLIAGLALLAGNGDGHPRLDHGRPARSPARPASGNDRRAAGGCRRPGGACRRPGRNAVLAAGDSAGAGRFRDRLLHARRHRRNDRDGPGAAGRIRRRGVQHVAPGGWRAGGCHARLAGGSERRVGRRSRAVRQRGVYRRSRSGDAQLHRASASPAPARRRRFLIPVLLPALR